MLAKIENETQARQGSKGKPVLYVLIGGIALAVIAAIGTLAWQSEKAPPGYADQSQNAAQETAKTKTE